MVDDVSVELYNSIRHDVGQRKENFMKPIIIYYSSSGNTEKIALQVKNDLNCEAIKIIPEEAYGNYISSCLRVTKEKKSPVAPTFITPIDNDVLRRNVLEVDLIDKKRRTKAPKHFGRCN